MNLDELKERVKFDPSKPETFVLEKITVYCQLPIAPLTEKLARGELKEETEAVIRRLLGLKPWNRVEVEIMDSEETKKWEAGK